MRQPIANSAILIFLISILCACTSQPAHSIFSGEAKNIIVPFTLHDNRVLVEVKINGAGPFTFIFDTGGSSPHTMTPEVARQLGLTTQRGADGSGAGEQKVAYWETKVETYSIGNLTLHNQGFGVLDLSAIKKSFGFAKLDGVLGYDVLKKSITCVDYDKRILILNSDTRNCFGSTVTVVPFRLDGDIPVIAGAVMGKPGEFLLDTGDRSALSVFAKFAANSGVEAQFSGKPEIISGRGVGGPIKARLSTLSEVRLGSDLQIHDVLARLPLTKSGAFAESRIAGSVGNDILRRFNTVFDYEKNEMLLVKNKHFAESFRLTPLVDAND